MKEVRNKTFLIAISAVSAGLYAISISYTAELSIGPVGVAELRPGIVIPMIFSCLFGPVVGFICAALGTFIHDFLMTGLHLRLLPGVIGNGIGAWVTSVIYRQINNRYDGIKHSLGTAIAASVGLGWVTGFIIGYGHFFMKYIPNQSIALTITLLIGIGNSIWAFTLFPAIFPRVKKYVDTIN